MQIFVWAATASVGTACNITWLIIHQTRSSDFVGCGKTIISCWFSTRFSIATQTRREVVVWLTKETPWEKRHMDVKTSGNRFVFVSTTLVYTRKVWTGKVVNCDDSKFQIVIKRVTRCFNLFGASLNVDLFGARPNPIKFRCFCFSLSTWSSQPASRLILGGSIRFIDHN